MKRTILLIGFLLSLVTQPYAQSNHKIEPLYKFMQANADTTIAIEQVSNWITVAPNVYLLSKKGDTLNCYTYRDLAYSRSNSVLIPTHIRQSMYKVHKHKILTEPVDVNEFFSVCAIKQETLQDLWKQIHRLRPWTLSDDKVDGEGCGVNGRKSPVIYDGGGLNLYLITGNEIKQLYFYAPAFYQKYCKWRRGREAVLKIEGLFREYVQ